jgi:hypothetical protein
MKSVRSNSVLGRNMLEDCRSFCDADTTTTTITTTTTTTTTHRQQQTKESLVLKNFEPPSDYC